MKPLRINPGEATQRAAAGQKQGLAPIHEKASRRPDWLKDNATGQIPRPPDIFVIERPILNEGGENGRKRGLGRPHRVWLDDPA